MQVELTVNGRVHAVEAPAGMPLLWVLRDRLGLTGTKYGCGIGLCGACTVHIDGDPARSCTTTVESASGREITTIEGLTGPAADALRSAWQAESVVQCGYCQSGQIMTAAALLERSGGEPVDADVDRAMSAVLCRCGTYRRIRAAITRAAGGLQ